MSQIGAALLQSWDESSRREWLTTNGIGGYASSSVSGANTRRYHGLLVPAFEAPLGRAVLLSKLEEEIKVEEELYLLSANKYPSVVNPQGFRHLAAFDSCPVPTFTFQFHEGTVVLEKRIWMAHGCNTVYIQYRLVKAPEMVRFGLIPLLSYKDYHTEQHRWDGFVGKTTLEADGRLTFVAYETAHPLYFTFSKKFAWSDHSGWFYNFEHQREMERGLDFSEDLFCPGRWDGTLMPGEALTVIATVEGGTPVSGEQALEEEERRQCELLKTAGVDCTDSEERKALTLAADQFVIPKGPKVSRATVIAGYHWFTDWGRDTMIALPGLCLTTRRFDIARDILGTFAGSVRRGLLPNRFVDSGEGAEYNTVDAGLWFCHAVHRYLVGSEDEDFVLPKMRPVIEDMISHHIEGTDYGIHVDPSDGLLSAGGPGVQLTWMDAKVGDWVVTPRSGKPVEINALWYNALRIAADLARRSKDNKKSVEFADRADRVKQSFENAFWYANKKSLFDCIGLDGRPDCSLRPNQIFAVSLPFAVIEGDKARAVVDVVGEALLTPYGLRTLAPGSPDYKSHYGPGNQTVRDGAYHQGTVWPWLLGAYIEAHLKVYKDVPAARALLLPSLEKAIGDYGVGTICEICDADSPYSPNGCIAQAWSVAEILRVLALL